MRSNIVEIINEINYGKSKDRLVLSDAAAVLLNTLGLDKDTAYYFTKCNGAMADDVLSDLSGKFFRADKVETLAKKILPVMAVQAETAMKTFSWKEMDVEKLDVEELEKMGTSLLRSATKSRDVDTKEINDLIKMLDAVGALPKKAKEVEDFKQVVVMQPYNEICQCGREVTVTDTMLEEHAAKKGWTIIKE